MKEPKGKTYSIEEADRLFNGGKEETAVIIVMMKKSRNGTISNRVMQEGKEEFMNGWAVMAAAYLLIECVLANSPGMGEIFSQYIAKPYMDRRAILNSVLRKVMEREAAERMEKENGH